MPCQGNCPSLQVKREPWKAAEQGRGIPGAEVYERNWSRRNRARWAGSVGSRRLQDSAVHSLPMLEITDIEEPNSASPSCFLQSAKSYALPASLAFPRGSLPGMLVVRCGEPLAESAPAEY